MESSHRWLQRRHRAIFLGLAACGALLAVLIQFQATFALEALTEAELPTPQVHPLPPLLAQWQSEDRGDYFSEVSPTEAGYLVWSRFPVKIYIEPPPDPIDRAPEWVEAVTQAVQEWNAYLSLEVVRSPEQADVTIWYTSPPLHNRDNNLRARSAETRYELYIDHPVDAPATLSHRFSILLRPGQTANYTQAAARHELGHALGIWGHSPLETDALYFSQVRNSPPISPRDINTLKRVYQQPTRLGWSLR